MSRGREKSNTGRACGEATGKAASNIIESRSMVSKSMLTGEAAAGDKEAEGEPDIGLAAADVAAAMRSRSALLAAAASSQSDSSKLGDDAAAMHGDDEEVTEAATLAA
ncbi:hypothetical protein HK101_003592 [Irineochytrium annulatum]|nr:hypothetical protein HK101_003592 [Irineochytrium annulatum]